MLREKTGRVTFMPINRLKPREVNYPNAPDAIPLIDKLRFDPLYEKAFRQVFGKTCVCRDLFVAAAYVRSHNLNTITLDGDKVDRKGSLTGGYHDVRRSRIEAIRNVATWREKYNTDNTNLKEVKRTILQIEQEITQLVGDLQVRNTQRDKILTSREPLVEEANNLEREHERLGERILKHESDVDTLKADLAGLQARIEDHEKEMMTPLSNSLSFADELALTGLSKEVDNLQQSLLNIGQEKNQVNLRMLISLRIYDSL